MARNKEHNACKGGRHPQGRHPVVPTPTHTLVSLGTLDHQILKSLSKNPDERFNVKRFSKITNKPRGTIYEALGRLKTNGFVAKDTVPIPGGGEREVQGTIRITTLGLAFLKRPGVSGTVRGECRSDVGSLSVHSVQFFFPISDGEQFTHVRLERAWPGLVREPVELPNYTQYRVVGDDFSLYVNPRTVVLELREYVDGSGGPISGVDARLVARAAKFVPLLRGVGLIVEGVRLQGAHYARLNSWFAASLEKIDSRYVLELGDGSNLWIDRSLGPLELESDRGDVVEKVDDLLRSYIEGERSWNDVLSSIDFAGGLADKQLLISDSLLRLHVEAHKGELLAGLGGVMPIDQKRLIDYVG